MTGRNERRPGSADKTVRDIRRPTRRKLSAEEKIRLVLEGLRGEETIAEVCRKEGINQNLHYRWSKDFLEAGKKRLAGDAAQRRSRYGTARWSSGPMPKPYAAPFPIANFMHNPLDCSYSHMLGKYMHT
jgi:transposase-like protein